jgi:hypothetical protein
MCAMLISVFVTFDSIYTGINSLSTLLWNILKWAMGNNPRNAVHNCCRSSKEKYLYIE